MNMNNENVKFLLYWNHFADHLISCMTKLMSDSTYSDIIIATGGKHMIYSHRFVLANSSKYFQRLLKQLNKKSGMQLVVALPEISYDVFKILMNYMYKGETQVPHELLPSVIKAGQFLEINGLVNLNEHDGDNSEIFQPEVHMEDETKTKFSMIREKVPFKEITIKSVVEKKPKKFMEEQSLSAPENVKEIKSRSKMQYMNAPENFIQLPLKRRSLLKNSTRNVASPPSTSSSIPADRSPSKKMPKISIQPNLLKLKIKTEKESLTNSEGENNPEIIELEGKITIKEEAPEVCEEITYNELQCEFCHEAYTNPPDWVKHMTEHHGDRGFKVQKNLDNGGRNAVITCVICSSVCFSPAEWAKHLQMWHSDRDFIVANMGEGKKNVKKSKKKEQVKSESND